ncbi:hypothetical protein SAMN05444920_116280 [Nonomuraea solani]|uniref:Uncharacterized protein n=1 Tax=Nonomuraea solani TaxID=1144553 RepID=A0A1H6EV26_9ACTN|nr:hypothetical protein [Nonomuraea solani]SEH00544.1 hypothetical protein SAMN05444920_116280 [Nonomuraea solani]
MKFAILGVGLALGAPALVSTPAPAAAAGPEGAYWHYRILTSKAHPGRFGSRAHPYTLVERQVMEWWSTAGGKASSGFRNLGAVPKSAADKKAWQRDGSPAKWTKSLDGKAAKLSTQPSKGYVTPMRNENAYQIAGQRLTYDEVQRLPADPNGLKGWLVKTAQVRKLPASNVDGWVSGSLPRILHAMPAPKQVRAAAYQALLTMPGVRSEGNATDPLGRAGVSVVIADTSEQKEGTLTAKTKMIIDTGEMVLLSQVETLSVKGEGAEREGAVQTVAETGWTDAPPAVPALP